MDRINQWDLTTISESSWLAKCFFILAIASLTICLSYCLLIKGNFVQYRLFMEEEKQLRTEFAKKLPEGDVEAYRKQLMILQNQANTLLKRLAKNHEIAASLEEISAVGLASGVVFELFSPGEKIDHGFYREIPLIIRAVGSYQQLAKFISNIVHLKYQVTVSNFIVKRENNYRKKEKEGNFLVMEITIKIINYV